MGLWLGQIPTKVYSADEVISPYIYVFYTAFLLAFVFTPVMRKVAVYYGIIDQPDRMRKIHKVPVAYLGGIAVFVGWLGGLAVSELLRLHRIDPGWPTDSAGIAHPIVRFGIVVGGLIIVLLGLWDDLFKLKPWMKIAGQIVAAAFLLWEGIGVDCMRGVLEPLSYLVAHMFRQNLPPGGLLPGWVIFVSSSAVVMAVVVGCCNATNLLDGMDGLCGGVTAVIAAAFMFVAVYLAMLGGGIYTNLDAQRVILGLALLGAVLGFIPYNFNPASIFMGDTGSMFLGYVCGTMIILMGSTQTKWFLASMVIFALPVLDTALAFARRWTNRRPLFSPDKQHIHHQLAARGYSINQTVLISYALAILFGVLGASMIFVRTRYAMAIYLVVFGSIIVAAYKMGMIHERTSGVAGGMDQTPPDAFSPRVDSASVLEIDVAPPSTTEEGDRVGEPERPGAQASPAAAPMRV